MQTERFCGNILSHINSKTIYNIAQWKKYIMRFSPTNPTEIEIERYKRSQKICAHFDKLCFLNRLADHTKILSLLDLTKEKPEYDRYYAWNLYAVRSIDSFVK